MPSFLKKSSPGERVPAATLKCCAARARISSVVCSRVRIRTQSTMPRARRERALETLHEFEAVAEGVENMETTKTAKRNVGLDGGARSFAAREKLIEAFDHQRGMGFLRGMKILFHAEMKIQRAAGKPAAAASGHRRRLGNFGEAEDAGIEFAGAVFAAGRNGDLDVVKRKDFHGEPSCLHTTADVIVIDGAQRRRRGTVASFESP